MMYGIFLFYLMSLNTRLSERETLVLGKLGKHEEEILDCAQFRPGGFSSIFGKEKLRRPDCTG